MGRIDTVAGLEKYLTMRKNTIECDNCGEQITPDSTKYVGGSLRLTAHVDHGWKSAGETDYCPRCQETGASTTE